MKKSAFPYMFINKDGQADGETGISQRLYVATKIAAAIVTDNFHNASIRTIVKDAFEVADELIKQDNENN